MNQMNQMQQIQPEEIPSEHEIFADNHSLFIDQRPPIMEPFRDDEGTIIEGIFEQQGGYTLYKLFLGEFMETGNGIHRIISKLQEAQPGDVLEFHISSNGGAIDELLEIYNLCDTLFFGNVTTFCNYAYSAGALAFLFGVDRCVYKHSDFMLHSYSGGFGGKRDDLLTRVKHEDHRIVEFFDDVVEPFISKKEMKKLQKGKDFWFGSEEMLRRGIATHIMVHGEIIQAKDYLDSLSELESKSSKSSKSSKKSTVNSSLRKKKKNKRSKK